MCICYRFAGARSNARLTVVFSDDLINAIDRVAEKDRFGRADVLGRTTAPMRIRNTVLRMKPAIILQVLVEPELRAELEAVLRQGESVSEFVEASVRNAVEFRRVQTQFYERGQAAWEHYRRTGGSVPAGEVLAKLQTKLDAKRQRLRK